DLRRQLPAAAGQRSRRRHLRADRDPGDDRAGAHPRLNMDSPDPIRTVVVDDEQLAREELCFLLGQIGDVDVVAQATNGIEALQAIEDAAPDLVMLDVQMPGLTGFEVARRVLASGGDAHVVFVTAYDQYAIEAFEVNA